MAFFHEYSKRFFNNLSTFFVVRAFYVIFSSTCSVESNTVRIQVCTLYPHKPLILKMIMKYVKTTTIHLGGSRT